MNWWIYEVIPSYIPQRSWIVRVPHYKRHMYNFNRANSLNVLIIHINYFTNSCNVSWGIRVPSLGSHWTDSRWAFFSFFCPLHLEGPHIKAQMGIESFKYKAASRWLRKLKSGREFFYFFIFFYRKYKKEKSIHTKTFLT